MSIMRLLNSQFESYSWNQDLYEIVYKAVSLNRCIIFSSYLLEDLGITTGGNRCTKSIGQDKGGERESPVRKKGWCHVTSEVI